MPPLAAGARPQVTVITPAFNVGNYIGEAIDSVLGQSFPDFEYFVIDDGSTDHTVAEIRRRASEDGRIRLITQVHAGASCARNTGISEASGEYIAFLDGDDRWHPDFLKKQLALLASLGPDVAAVFARSRAMSESGRVYLLRWQRAGQYDFDQMLVKSCPPRNGSSLLLRKSSFSQERLFSDIESAQDLDMWLRVQHESGMPYFWGGKSYLLDIRVRPGAISRNYQKRFEALDKLINSYKELLSRYPSSLAYLRPSVFAYRAGEDGVADRWAEAVLSQVGYRALFLDPYGWRMIGWKTLSPRYRRVLRGGTQLGRSLVGRLVGARGAVLR